MDGRPVLEFEDVPAAREALCVKDVSSFLLYLARLHRCASLLMYRAAETVENHFPAFTLNEPIRFELVIDGLDDINARHARSRSTCHLRKVKARRKNGTT